MMIKCAADVNKAISFFMVFTRSNVLPKNNNEYQDGHHVLDGLYMGGRSQIKGRPPE